MEKTLNLLCIMKLEECPTLFLRANWFLLLDRVAILYRKEVNGKYSATQNLEEGGSRLRLVMITETKEN